MTEWILAPSCRRLRRRLHRKMVGSAEAVMLETLSKQGGAGFVALVSLAETGDKRAAEEIHDMAWEQLHSGPWHAVDAVWRDAYSLSSLFIAACFEREGRLEKALKYLDMGLIMGGLLFRGRLETAIASIQGSLSGGPLSIDSEGVGGGGGDRAIGMAAAEREGDSAEELGCAERGSGGIPLPGDESVTAAEVVEAEASSPVKGLKKRKDPPDQRRWADGDDTERDSPRARDVDAAAKLKWSAYTEVTDLFRLLVLLIIISGAGFFGLKPGLF